MLLANHNVVITGCNRGIGRAILTLFAHHGANVWACIRHPCDAFDELARSLRKETGVRIEPICFDLADPNQVKAGVQRITAEKQPVHVLVNNAGAIHTAPFVMTTEKSMREMLDVNFLGPVLLCQYISRLMTRQRNGSIINIASSAAIDGNEGRTAYAAAKAAMLTATKVLARELGSAGVRVNAIAPGLTNTDMLTGSTSPEAQESTLSHTILRRVGRPEEIAGAALFLASGLSSYVTGQVLRVDGGM